MYKTKQYRILFALLSILLVALVSCGRETDTAAPAADVPAAQEAVVEVVEESTDATMPAEDSVDVAAAVDAYLSTIPDGFMAVGALDAVKEMMDAGGAVVIDVREIAEYEAGHIPGAINIPMRTLAQNLDNIPTDQPVLIYCASGHRAGMSTSALRVLGYENVRAYPPGWKGWSAAGEEVSIDAPMGETYDVPEIDPGLLATVDEFLSGVPEGFYAMGSVEKLTDAQDAGALVLDVREIGEFDGGAISGAVNIPIRTIGASLAEIPQDQQVIVYCASGFRAALATSALHIMGYDNVRSFPPGYGAWEAAQVEGGEVPVEAEADVDMAADSIVIVDEYLSSIPEGYMAVGKIDAFKEMLEATDVYLIDIRETSEYEAGHLPGAVNIPMRTLTENLDKIPTDQPVMIYCASGHRAGLSLSALRVLGYDNVRSFPPGYRGWTAAEQEVTTEPVEAGAFEEPEIDRAALDAATAFLTNVPEGFYAIGAVDNVNAAIDAGAFVVDVREADEYARGHIAGAINVPMRSLGQSLDQIPTEQPVIVYCASGHRAALSAAALQMMGYTNVRSFPAGYGAWEASGGPVE